MKTLTTGLRSLFAPVERPAGLANPSLLFQARWLSWSHETRAFLRDFAGHCRLWPAPKLISLCNGAEFDKTYTLRHAMPMTPDYSPMVDDVALALLALDIKRELVVFKYLLDEEIDGEVLHYFFAILRDRLAQIAGKEMASLYAPLGYVGPKATDFPLHADLYAPNMLWNVFDRVPGDGSGAAIFMPVSEFESLLAECAVPGVIQDKILGVFRADNEAKDRFREFYQLVHLTPDDWAAQLTAKLNERQHKLPVHYGDGYLLNDRKWLHGRMAPTGGVTEKRVHRLVFERGDRESRTMGDLD